MSNAHQNSSVRSRKPYLRPRLRPLGDLRSLTLGGSPGVGDSGGSWIRTPPVHGPQPGGYYPPEFFPRPMGAPAPGEEKSDDQP